MSENRAAIVTQVKAARRVSTPLIAVVTPDPAATIDALRDGINGATPMIVWDVAQGFKACNEPGKDALGAMLGESGDRSIGNPPEAMRTAWKLPEGAVLFVHMANRWTGIPQWVQAVWLLRDRFKVDKRTLILLGPSMDLPAELAGDVVVFDEQLPDAEALRRIIVGLHKSAELELTPETASRAVEAVQGLPAFQAEQVAAMSLSRSGLDIEALWERKRRQIELTPGLKVHRGDERFDSIGGVDVIKGFLQKILHGQARPNAVVFIDEIEKMIAGAGSGGGGDTSGVSQDQLGTLLSYMQDQRAVGMIFVGPPGSAKSMVAKAAGNEAGIPTIQLDMGGVKGSLVGESEQQLRSALKVITSVSNGRSLWIATCNSIRQLPPELRRRFTLGTYFFDLPDAAERKAIWKIHTAGYGQAARGLPADEGWTGAEIRQCCDIAWRLGATLKEASAFVVPVSQSASDQIEQLRKSATGKFLSANKPGVYRFEDEPTTPARSRRPIEMDGDA